MNLFKWSATLGAVALAGLLTAQAMHAQDMNTNKKTYLTFSAPVEVPGATLQPGKYLFQLADIQSNRHIVQIFNEDGSKLIVTTLTIPDRRMEATGDPVVKFLETPAGAPAAIRTWFYPGDVTGDEFIYPKDQAMRIARATNQTVLSSDTISGDGLPDMKAETTARINAEGQAVEEKAEAGAKAAATPPPAPPAPSASASASASSAGASAQATAPSGSRSVGTSGRTELPRTASNTPLIGLIGLLSLLGAASVRVLARNRA
jgi:hypothetical protein